MMKYRINDIEADTANPYSIIHNFEVSVIMPFFRKMVEFRQVLPLNVQYFQRNGIEVIIVVDDNDEQDELINFIKKYPFVNWKIIVNPFKHEWRNPVKVINVGIRHATKKYIMVCSPESQFNSDAIYLMRRMLDYYTGHFVIGTVAFATEQDIISKNFKIIMPYGSIMCKKADIEGIGGYDESLISWGGDDDNIRSRLEMSGIKKIFLPEVKLIHKEQNQTDVKKRYSKRILSLNDQLNIFYPKLPTLNSVGTWGRDFNHIVYDWRKKNELAKELAECFLKSFEQYELRDIHIFENNYSTIVLAQSYNEVEYIIPFLEDMALYFDGIILLDDGSIDDTYETANHPKLLVKIKKKRIAFLDLDNRNTLLKLASFFSSEWFCFMDIDERFDPRFTDFAKVLSYPDINIISFKQVNLWNNPKTYNAEYPYSKKGICDKLRMFRNIGYAQIQTSKKQLHFAAVPYQRNILKSEILFYHYGNISKERREKRYKLYMQEDIQKDQYSYEHLLVNNPKMLCTDDIFILNGEFRNRYDDIL